LVSRDPGRFDLRFTLSQVEVNTTLGADVFKVDIPRSARPMTIDELRDARPGLRQD
jgi:outer membrane lipoprotein-sorting protein